MIRDLGQGPLPEQARVENGDEALGRPTAATRRCGKRVQADPRRSKDLPIKALRREGAELFEQRWVVDHDVPVLNRNA
jgi:hypothetical protein